jgi:REP element-mobilizing transposase RayT
MAFSTKERRPMLRDAGLRAEMHKYLGGISNKLDCPPILIGGTDDHVHLLGRQARTIALAEWIKELKRGSSIWIKTKDTSLAGFEWQAGYGAFSVSQSQSDRVENYIAGQEEHHRRLSFQDEFRRLLEKHKIEYDERYVWD